MNQYVFGENIIMDVTIIVAIIGLAGVILTTIANLIIGRMQYKNKIKEDLNELSGKSDKISGKSDIIIRNTDNVLSSITKETDVIIRETDVIIRETDAIAEKTDSISEKLGNISNFVAEERALRNTASGSTESALNSIDNLKEYIKLMNEHDNKERKLELEINNLKQENEKLKTEIEQLKKKNHKLERELEDIGPGR